MWRRRELEPEDIEATGKALTARSVLLASNYNVWREPFNAQAHALLNVVASVEKADLLAPEGASYLSGHAVRPSIRYLFAEIHHRLMSQARIRIGRPGLSNMVDNKVDNNYDLFFFVCQFPQELAALNRIIGWRSRTGTAIIYILETWSSSLSHAASNLRLLDKFDHVFVINAESIPQLRKYTSTPISCLAPAADCLMAAPLPAPPRRSIDVYSYGRRAPAIHAQLLELCQRSNDFHYVYDSIRGGQVKDWLDHRWLNASQMKRSKYFMAFNPSDLGAGGKGESRNEQAISTRYFEGAAGGAVMLGSSPRCGEFKRHFDWPDAVIPLAPTGDVAELLSELASQEDRLRAVSHRNVVESLRRHDWSHRWQQVLETIGLEGTAELERRQKTLRQLSELEYEWR